MSESEFCAILDELEYIAQLGDIQELELDGMEFRMDELYMDYMESEVF